MNLVAKNYDPGVEVPCLGDVYACKKCGAVVIASAVDRHAAWHVERDGKVVQVHHHHYSDEEAE